MIHRRVVKLQRNPEPCGGRKPASDVTDRALRYRANSEECKPGPPMRCLWCGERDVQVGHIDGDETNTNPGNLAWTCWSCNQKVAAAMKKAGAGRRTKQFNPPKRKGATSKGQYAWALAVMRGDEEGDVSAAAEIVQATNPDKRSDWNYDFWKIRKQKYGPSGRKDGGKVPF